MVDRKFTEEECVANGGHFWKYWSGNDIVDPINFEIDNSCGRKLGYYPDGEPQYRGCPLCGRKEVLIPARWEKQPDIREIMAKLKSERKEQSNG